MSYIYIILIKEVWVGGKLTGVFQESFPEW
jgi:hypothetical protein